MPIYNYECLIEAGGCGQTFEDFKPMHGRQNVQCPNCSMDGNEQYVATDGVVRYRIAQIITRVNVTMDIDKQDGRLGEPVTLSTGQRVTSRRQMKDALKVAREQIFLATDGEKEQMRPVTDPKTGKKTFEKFTTKMKGVDHGELHHLEGPPEKPRDQRSPFDEKLSMDEHINSLTKELGEE